jgi:hypothetical protein
MWQQQENGIINKVLGQKPLTPGKHRLKMAQISAEFVALM